MSLHLLLFPFLICFFTHKCFKTISLPVSLCCCSYRNRSYKIWGKVFKGVGFMTVWLSVQFSRSVVCDSLRPHESQHARPPCPSPTPGVDLNSCPRVADAIQPSHSLSSPPHPAPNPSQHQDLFQWVNFSHEMAKVWSFSLSISPSSEHPGLSPLGWTGWISLQSLDLKRETNAQKGLKINLGL